jgi:hypothetical protein
VDFRAAALDDLRFPLAATLAHIQLIAVKRLSDAGRRRLYALDAQTRFLMWLLETRTTRCAQVTLAHVDLSAMIGEVVSELDAVLSDEASRPC